MQRRLDRGRELPRAHRDEPAHARDAEDETSDPANRRQHDSFGQHLPHEPPLPGAERRPDRQLATPSGRPHQEQIRDVGARNQQHEQHAALQDQQRRAHVADQLIAHADREPAEAARLRELRTGREPVVVAIDNRLDLRVQLIDGRAGAEPRDHHAELVAARVVGHLLRRERERHQERDVARRKVEVRGQHADDAVGAAVEADVAADDRLVPAESRAPERVREYRELVRFRLRLLFREAPAEERLAAERGEEGRRDRQGAKLLRLSSFRKRGRPSGKERRVLDRRRLRLAVQIVGDRHARLREPNQRIRVPHEDQPLRVRVRQRPEQNLVQEAENGGIGANSQRQRHHGHQGEDRLLAQRADGIAKVLHGALDESAAERVARERAAFVNNAS